MNLNILKYGYGYSRIRIQIFSNTDFLGYEYRIKRIPSDFTDFSPVTGFKLPKVVIGSAEKLVAYG